MDWLYSLFVEHSALQAVVVLSLISAIGLGLGKIHICGISLGVTFVFFAGILAGHFGLSIDPQMLNYAESFGLVIFVYALGLQVGPGFFSSFRTGGVQLNMLAVGVVLIGTLMTLLGSYGLGVSLPDMVGILCGATTNTPALGAAQQTLKQMGIEANTPALGCAVAYPIGVVGVILGILMIRKALVRKADLEVKEVIVLLGVRKAESIARKRRIEGRELTTRMLNRHETIPNAYVYNPIVELTTEDVWTVLLEHNSGKTPWGSDNSELVALYSDADSGECPFAGMSNSGQTQSCGQSRFGCWCCTVVKEDKSLNGFIKAGHRELIPLAEFRTWLMSIRDVDKYREKKHRDGTVYADKHGNKGYGPFTWEARKLVSSGEVSVRGIYGYV